MLQTAYMGMEKNSSPETRKRAADLAKVIGANHLDFEYVSYSQTPSLSNYYCLRKSLLRIFDLQYANLSPTALTPCMTHKLSSLPRPRALSQSSRCMAAPKSQILPYSMSSTLFSRPQSIEYWSFSPLYISNLSLRNIQARLRMVRNAPPAGHPRSAL